MENLKVIKIGGKIISDPEKLDLTLNSFAKCKEKKVLIHGGGNVASELANNLNVPVVMVEGRRVTDDPMLEIISMVYSSLNKQICAQLQALSINAIGLSGTDGNLIQSVRRPVKAIDYGNVGDIVAVNNNLLKSLLEVGLVPIICPLTHDGKGNLLNTNADTIASSIAIAMQKSYNVQLTYAFELNGVLKNIEDKNSIISSINTGDFKKMKTKGSINSGMIPKIHNAMEASKKGVQEVFICNSGSLEEPQKGTEICYH